MGYLKKILLYSILLVLILTSTTIVSSSKNLKQSKTKLLNKEVAADFLQQEAISADDELSMEDIQKFAITLMQIKHYYFKNIKNSELLDRALKGLVSSLDPHSAFLDQKENIELTSATEGQFGGIGIELTLEDNFPKIIAPLDNSPAKLAGLQSGDYIIKIDNNFVEGVKLPEIISQLRGKQGTKVKLGIIRKGQNKPLFFNVTREVIKPQSITSYLLDQDLAYIRIAVFQEPTAKDFTNAIYQLNKSSTHGLKGLILDLRNNPGGLLASAISVANELIDNDQKGDEEIIVHTKGKVPDANSMVIATPGDLLKGEPIVVLINEGSASAAEIVAGALQDNKRAILIGTKSFGKGSVQSIIPIDQQSSIKITTALYYTPLNKTIQAEGLTPDFLVPELAPFNTLQSDEQLSVTEKNLSGHIVKQQKTLKKESVNKPLPEQLRNDYQLAEAIKIIKVMRFTKLTTP